MKARLVYSEALKESPAVINDNKKPHPMMRFFNFNLIKPSLFLLKVGTSLNPILRDFGYMPFQLFQMQ